MWVSVQLKEKLIEKIKQTEFGNRKFCQLKKALGREPIPDLTFPELISIELSSRCNLACAHCPPHMKEFSTQTRVHSHIDFNLFIKLMDEIDKYGNREIALHKDGEPLLHPQIIEILERVKLNKSHTVYLTTNAHNLNNQIIEALLVNKIDIINFSIGANSEELYRKIRGKGFAKVISNIKNFLHSVENSEWKPKISVQIINLPEHQEMDEEIKKFKIFWSKFNVNISVWEKLTWNVFEDNNKLNYRYPCYSLWNSFNINSNAIVTACCMDWKQELVVGNVNNQKISEIWKASELKQLRQKHINGEEENIETCRNCNYWQWQPMLLKYPIK